MLHYFKLVPLYLLNLQPHATIHQAQKLNHLKFIIKIIFLNQNYLKLNEELDKYVN